MLRSTSSTHTNEQGASRARFIIAHGWLSDVIAIEAPSLEAAEAEARRLSRLDGLHDDDLDETTWAAPYTEWLARKVGLIDTPDDHSAAQCDPRHYGRW